MRFKLKNLFRHRLLVKYLKNTSWLFLEKVFRIFVGLFVGAWMARYLEPDAFGLYSYALSFVGLFAIFSSLGMDSVLVKELVNHETKDKEIINTGLFLRFTASLIVISVIFITSNIFINDRLSIQLILITSSSVLLQSFNIIDLHLQSRVLGRYTAYVNSVSLFSSSLLKIFLIINQASLVAFVYVVIFESAVLAGGYIYIYMKTSSSHKIAFKFVDIDLGLSILKKSWPVLISTVFVTIYMKIDQIMIMQFLGSSAVGQYAVALKLSESWYFIPGVVATSFFPAIISAKNISSLTYNYRLSRLYSLMIYLSAFIAIVVTLWGGSAIEFLYGDQYKNARVPLIIHIWAGVFVFVGNITTRWMINENLQIYAATYSGIGAILNITLNYFLIPKMGVTGAAISTLVSYSFSTYFCLLLSSKTRIAFLQLSKSVMFSPSLNSASS